MSDTPGNDSALTEKALASRAAAGDSDAFTQIVKRYEGPVYNLCYRYLGPANAEDAAQETFIRAFVHRGAFDPDRPLLPWLITIARRLCIDRLRRSKRETLSNESSDALADSRPTAEDATASQETLGQLATMLETLPEGQREAISLYHIDELSYEDVAKTLDVPIGTVMTWLHRGRVKLRTLLTQSAGHAQAAPGGK
ncbi:MAG: RNA polymerase sigma factor [Myxococcota bacterium]|nr:RNA polymerase sigma factor [Myxococcota bacterium]